MGKECLNKSLVINFFLTNDNISPRLLFRSSLLGVLSKVKNLGLRIRNVPSHLLSYIIKILIYSASNNCSISNSFLIELMFKRPMETLLG